MNDASSAGSSQHTIAAIATPTGAGGIAVIRISGTQSWPIAERLCPSENPLLAGQIHHRWLKDPVTNDTLDEVLVLAFKAPKSFTGEDCIEIHCHGGLALSQLVLEHCLNAGATLASAGEFSRRAVLNNRLDLSQAESILDLIHAEGSALIKAAARNLKDSAHAAWVADSTTAIAHIQASMVAAIDFPDEVDEPDRHELLQALNTLTVKLQGQLSASERLQVSRDGFRVAILGRPNAGKSSLFNTLLCSNRAIVTEHAGTTRDVLQERLVCAGVPVTLVDTAGLRDITGSSDADEIEKIGIERSWQESDSADAILYVIDSSHNAGGVSIEDVETLQRLASPQGPGLILLNKCDLNPSTQSTITNLPVSWPVQALSTLTGEGVSALTDWLSQHIQQQLASADGALLFSKREQACLELVIESLESTKNALEQEHIPLDIATVPLTSALVSLQAMLGRDTTEHMLDSVFSRFCVGK